MKPFDATKGAYPGTVKLQWHVNQQGSTTAKTYIVERRRTEKDTEPWVTLYRTSSSDEYLFYTDDTPLPGVYYDYRVTVQDKCDNGTIIPNDITDIGFALTTGTMSGRITFGATGSSVANVEVEAKRTGTSGGDEEQYHAMRFTDTYGEVTWNYPSSTYAADKFSTGDLSLQMWVYPEELAEAKIVRLNGEKCWIGMNANGQLTLVKFEGVYTFGNAVLTAGKYNHVVLTRSGDNVTAAVVGTNEAGEAVLNSDTIIVEGAWHMTGATQLSLGFFKGYVDEFRIWTKALTKTEIMDNYDHLLVGNEKQLETYWTFDEGLHSQFFDYSRDGTVYHQHHGKTGSNAEPSNLTPTQLKLKAKTDRDGNYIIQGVPFQGEGTTYAVIPTLGIHQFNPTQQLRYVGNNSLVHNGTDFTDISSFPVRGTIRYAGTDYPLEGVNFYVDGQICAKEGQPITTNAYGEYEISVPIGQHYITVQKQGHEFADGGRYPADPNKTGTLVNYNDAVSGLDFEDVTLVTVAAPALRVKPEEENVSFTFVASDNKIVIELNEEPARVEGCTLNFTVRDVHDQNGNLSEPVTWTAFVNQNPLSWKEGSVCCVANATTGATLTATLVNKSGKQQVWTMGTLPSWLEADMTYGDLDPLAEQTITFTVSESTPIGKYERTVYVAGNDGIETPLTLIVKITGEQPDWTVKGSDYELSMNLIGKLDILGTPCNDADDIVAAFIGDECRGVAQAEYNNDYDAFFVTMDIFGNSQDENHALVFKVYDASTGTIYPVVKTTLPAPATASEVLFEPDNLIGRYHSPVLLSATDEVEQIIELDKGWTWMSLNVQCGNMTVPEVFAKAGGKVSTVKSQNAFIMHNNDQWGGNLTEMSSSKMYAVQTTDALNLSVTGHRVVTANDSISVMTGWNWVGYNAQGMMSVTDALAGMSPQEGDIIKGQPGVAYYSNNKWMGSLKTMAPGKGYKIYTEGGSRKFAYPTAVALSRGANLSKGANLSEEYKEPSCFTPIAYSNYPANMVLIAQVVGNASQRCDAIAQVVGNASQRCDAIAQVVGNASQRCDVVGEASKLCSSSPLSGIELGIFAGDECRAAAVTDDEGMVYITIPGNEPCHLTFRIADGQSSIFNVQSSVTYQTDAVIGTPTAPFVINLSTPTAVQYVALPTQQTEQVYDLQGRRLNVEANSSLFTNHSSLKKGVYIINGQKKVK